MTALFHYMHPSHAVTEVKTSRGWMLVDSNVEWIALTRMNEPVNADDVGKHAIEFNDLPIAYKQPYWAIRGLYSRRGQLYPPYNYIPDVNWPDFLSWIVKG